MANICLVARFAFNLVLLMYVTHALNTKDLERTDKVVSHTVSRSTCPCCRDYIFPDLPLEWKEFYHTITSSDHQIIHCAAKHPKMAQQSHPVNDPTHEIQTIPRNADPQFAYIRLRYDWSTEQHINSTRWQPHLLVFRGTDAYSVILDDIADYIHRRLFRLEPTLCARLDRDNTCIVFQLTVQCSDKLKRHACRIDTSGTPRLDAIEDLFGDVPRPELRVLLVNRAEEPRDINSTHSRVEIRTRDPAIPFAEDDPVMNRQLTYKFWKLSQLRPKIPTFPSTNKTKIVITSRFVQHLEPHATGKFDFERHIRAWDPDSVDYASVERTLLDELED